MLSPTRTSTQTILKAAASTAASAMSESTTVEQRTEPVDDDTNDQEPLKKKFKDDVGDEITTECSSPKAVETKRNNIPKKRKGCVLFGYCGKKNKN